jgi:chemotaxis-related protein WspD
MGKEKADIDNCWKRMGVWSSGTERCPILQQVHHCRNCEIYAATGRQLLNRPQSPDYRDALTTTLAEEQPKVQNNARAAFVFKIGQEWLALDVSVIREIAPMAPIHTIPHLSSNILRGLVNIKGKLEICVSIGPVLGIGRCEQAAERIDHIASERLVIAVHEEDIITFPVSEIFGVVRYSEESLKAPPITVSGSKAVYTSAILCFDDKDIGLLKNQPLFRTLTRDLA